MSCRSSCSSGPHAPSTTSLWFQRQVDILSFLLRCLNRRQNITNPFCSASCQVDKAWTHQRSNREMLPLSLLSATHPSLSHCLGAMRHVAGVFLYFEPSCISVFLLSADWTTMGSGGAQQDCQVWGNIRRNPQKTKKQSQQRLIYRPSTTFLQKSPLPVLDDISADNILPICRSGYFPNLPSSVSICRA